ncbi:hypothetical protein AMECASPLE_014693 [Ameca splendens]|uniref:Activating transcription factor 7-interacting protein Fn3 domain-containing protein n=1 Tax=Ameca splendens TaxID=208324 RepID=A0ABV0Y1J8_9TELE
MSAIPDQSPASTGSSGPADLSTEHKRGKHLNRTMSKSSRRDCRINIGLAFKNWRSLKVSYGFRSDAEMALNLLDERLKTLPPGSGPTRASDMKLKISQSEVQTLIEQEVQKAVANRERELQSVIQHIQDTNDEIRLETSIQKLENRINAIARRAEVVFSHIANTQKQSSPSSTGNTDILRESPQHDPVEAMSQIEKKRTSCEAKGGELLQMMETTRNALKRLCADNEVLTTAMADLEPQEPPPVLTPWGSPDSKEINRGLKSRCSSNEDLCEKKPPPCLVPFDSSECMVGSGFIRKLSSTIKREVTDFQEEDYNDKKLEHFEEPVAKRIKKDDSPPSQSSSPPLKEIEGIEPMKDVEDMFFYPPLPNIPFPSVLKMEAASYSMPQRVEVNLAFIRNPTRISVLWNVEDKNPCAPPMESYTILLTMETFKGSGVFLKWDTYDKLEAKSLPMCALINKYKRGHRLCAAVVGKDIFGRYGPYSKVATAILPD